MIGYAARNSEGALRAEIWENLIRKSEKMPTLSFAHYFRFLFFLLVFINIRNFNPYIIRF